MPVVPKISNFLAKLVKTENSILTSLTINHGNLTEKIVTLELDDRWVTFLFSCNLTENPPISRIRSVYWTYRCIVARHVVALFLSVISDYVSSLTL